MNSCQPSLFDDDVSEIDPRSTAIYPNRVKNKIRVEAEKGLDEFGDASTRFVTPKGTLFAIGYVRIVYGDHGPYIEFRRGQITVVLRRRFNREPPPQSYYEWLEPIDGSGVKVYDQKRDVKHIKNAPNGGFAGNREEGYADYLPGMIYVSPFELSPQSHLS